MVLLPLQLLPCEHALRLDVVLRDHKQLVSTEHLLRVRGRGRSRGRGRGRGRGRVRFSQP